MNSSTEKLINILLELYVSVVKLRYKKPPDFCLVEFWRHHYFTKHQKDFIHSIVLLESVNISFTETQGVELFSLENKCAKLLTIECLSLGGNKLDTSAKVRKKKHEIASDNNFDNWMLAKLDADTRNRLYETLHSDVHAMLFEHNPVTHEMKLSDNFYTKTGYEHGSITHISQFLKIINPHFTGELPRDVYEDFHSNEKDVLTYEHQIIMKSGELLWVSTLCRKVWIPELQTMILIGFFIDITERKQTETDLIEKNSIYNLIFNGNKEATYKLDVAEDVIVFSESFYEMLGYEPGSISNMHEFSNIILDKSYLTLRHNIDAFVSSNDSSSEYEDLFLKKDGTYIWVLTRTNKVHLPGTNKLFLVGLYLDITESKKSKEALHKLAYYDTTTNLPNRLHLLERLESVVKEKTSGYLFLLNLDAFKKINGYYGHQFGDRVLQEIAKRLESSLPRGTFISRIGGDEFAIIVETKSQEEFTKILDRLTDSLSLPHVFGSMSVFVTACIGSVDLMIERSDEISHLVLASIALTKAKSKGLNQRDYFDINYLKKVQRDTEIETALRTAIQNDELYCVFQPVFNAKTNGIYSFESLLRFNSQELGNVPPNEFIPIAEKTGQIAEIGLFGLHFAAKKISEWVKKGYKFEKFNFNVANTSLHSLDFIKMITELHNKFELDYKMLNIEITESGLVDFQDHVVKVMESILGYGVNFSIDDFGTGFSSFSYLSESYFSSLKIDMSYIQRITHSKNDEKLVRNLIQLGHVLDMKVVAEGVETKEQLDMLIEMDVDYIQGYYLSKPLSAEDAEELLKSRM